MKGKVIPIISVIACCLLFPRGSCSLRLYACPTSVYEKRNDYNLDAVNIFVPLIFMFKKHVLIMHEYIQWYTVCAVKNAQILTNITCSPPRTFHFKHRFCASLLNIVTY